MRYAITWLDGGMDWYLKSLLIVDGNIEPFWGTSLQDALLFARWALADDVLDVMGRKPGFSPKIISVQVLSKELQECDVVIRKE